MQPVTTPRVFSGRYELTHLVARGGMAQVYRARDRLLDRPVALKVLFPELSVDRAFVERFRREAQAAANLSHPNIVPVFDWGEDGGTYYIVMEYIDGQPLSQALRAGGPMPPARVAHIGARVADALAYAHRHGVVHRDVKPGNVLLTNDEQVKVTDFGIARAVNTEESLTQTGAVMGTATYFSPEQAEGMGVDARSDIYSLGVVLFEMVTGRPPFLGDTPVAVASKHVRDHPPAPRELNPAVPPTFEAVILKAMAKDPAFRYQTAEDLRADLLRFNEGRSVLAMSDATQAIGAVGGAGATQMMSAVDGAEPLPPAPPVQRNRTRTYAVILAILLVALVVLGLLLARSLGYLGGSPSFNLANVVGKPVAQATATLQADGLTVRTSKVISTQASGTVLSQNPRANALVKKGDTVTLTVATAAQTTVPSGITSTTLANAQQILEAAGLQWKVTNVANAAPAGTVLSSDPVSGASIDQGGTVNLTVSSGPSSVTVPALAGQTQVQAANALGQQGLNLGKVTSQPSTQYAAGIVIASVPAEGTQVQPGSSVDIIVSSGPPPPTTTTTTPPTTTTTSTSTTSSSTSTTSSTVSPPVP